MTNTKPSKVFRNPKKKVADHVNTYRAVRTLKLGGEKRWPGELVPEAHTWLRVENYTHSGYLEDVRVSEADFDEAVQKFCPDLADRLAEKAKGAPVADKEDTKFTGFMFNEDGQVEDVAAKRALARERKLSETPAADRPASFDAAGTPEYMEQNSPEHVHSDGGSTLWSEKNLDGTEKYLAPDDARKAEKDELKEEGPKLASPSKGESKDSDDDAKPIENKPGRTHNPVKPKAESLSDKSSTK